VCVYAFKATDCVSKLLPNQSIRGVLIWATMPEENALQQTHLTFSAAVTVLGCVCVCVCLVEV